MEIPLKRLDISPVFSIETTNSANCGGDRCPQNRSCHCRPLDACHCEPVSQHWCGNPRNIPRTTEKRAGAGVSPAPLRRGSLCAPPVVFWNIRGIATSAAGLLAKTRVNCRFSCRGGHWPPAFYALTMDSENQNLLFGIV